jgi:outer membrane protein, heavy metal efflux system
MRHWLGYLSICLLCGLSPAGVIAQPAPPQALTITQAVQEALDHNLTLLAERYNLTVADARMVTARLRPNPVLSLGGDHLDVLGTGYNQRNGAGPPEASARVDFVFERGGKRQYRITVAEQAQAVTRLQLLNTTRTLMLDVQNAGVDVLLAKANLTLAQESLRAFNNIVQANEARVQAGDLAVVELERVRVSALQFENEVNKSESALLQARIKLQTLVGRSEVSDTFDVIGELRRDSQPVNMEAVLHQALAFRPDYQALVIDQARSLAELRLQIAQGKVDYTIGAEYRRQEGVNGRGNSLGFFVSVPLPVFNRNQGEIERARQEYEQNVVRLRALEASIRTEVRTTYQQYAVAQRVLQRTETPMLEQAAHVQHAMEYSYRRGQSRLVDFLDAQRTFNETRQSYNEARAEYARSLYQLDAVSGASVNPAAAGVQ